MTNLKTTISAVAISTALLSATDSFAYSNECLSYSVVGVQGYRYVQECYDNDENMISEKHYINDPDEGETAVSTLLYTYDNKGNHISSKSYDGDFPENGGTLKSTALYTYDDQNRQTSQAVYMYGGDPNDGIIPTVAYAVYYDENGNQRTKGVVYKQVIATYDENGNMIEQKTGTTEEERREFLASFMPDRVVTDSNGNVIARFDGANRLRYAQDADGSAYTYDKNGNLSKATKRGPFTIPEANALTKDGPVNTVTFTW